MCRWQRRWRRDPWRGVYAHGPQRVSQRQLVGGVWTFSYYGYDESMGSVRLLTDSGGLATDRYAYDGFGNVVGRLGSTANGYLYSGELTDERLGLQYLRARWYRLEVGRFLTIDTDEGCSCNPLTQHGYLYAHGNPIKWLDHTGHGILDRAILIATVVLRVTLPRLVAAGTTVAIGAYIYVQSVATTMLPFMLPVMARLCLAYGGLSLADLTTGGSAGGYVNGWLPPVPSVIACGWIGYLTLPPMPGR